MPLILFRCGLVLVLLGHVGQYISQFIQFRAFLKTQQSLRRVFGLNGFGFKDVPFAHVLFQAGVIQGDFGDLTRCLCVRGRAISSTRSLFVKNHQNNKRQTTLSSHPNKHQLYFLSVKHFQFLLAFRDKNSLIPNHCSKSHIKAHNYHNVTSVLDSRLDFVTTVEALLATTLVSDQLYLWSPF